MASCGFTHAAIARCIGVDGIAEKTLRLHFRRELDTAADMANARVGTVAYKKAIGGESWAVCFWMKCRAGWRETQAIDLNANLEAKTALPQWLLNQLKPDGPMSPSEPNGNSTET